MIVIFYDWECLNLFKEDTDKVAVNEAIELAKVFSTINLPSLSTAY